jgi:LPXTG-motif cell wall-anchored protein
MTSLRTFAITFFVACVAYTNIAAAQDTSKTTTSQSGQATQQVQVQSGEIISVSGNELIIKMSDGQIKHVTAAPGATAMVDGKEIGIKDARPGMKLTRTITTTSTPMTISTVRTIKGKVFYVNPPNTVILMLGDGKTHQYKVPPNQVFDIAGDKKDVFHLRKGMLVLATVITETPQVNVSQTKNVSGELPPPPPTLPPAPEMQNVLLVEEEVTELPAPPPTPAPAETAQTLPQTGSQLPLIGLLGLIALGFSLGMKVIRRLG